jgi:hypothetical protein
MTLTNYLINLVFWCLGRRSEIQRAGLLSCSVYYGDRDSGLNVQLPSPLRGEFLRSFVTQSSFSRNTCKISPENANEENAARNSYLINYLSFLEEYRAERL